MTPELADLIARLEKATGPDRELDCEIATLVGHFPSDNWRRSWSKADIPQAADNWKVPNYTASLDAAMMLVPEGWTASVLALPNTSQRVNGARGVVSLYEGAALSQTRCLMPEIEATTPALALCIAALKAQAADLGD